jgi:hypothetical protein
MTKNDIEHLAQVSHSLVAFLPDEELDRYVDRMLWAIRSSHDNPRFDEQKFRLAAKGGSFSEIFKG